MRVLAIVVLLTLRLKAVLGEESSEYLEEYWLYREAIHFVEECGNKDFFICLKEKSLQYLDNLPNSIDFGGGLRIKQTDGNRTSRHHDPIALPKDPKAREEVLDEVLMEKFTDYMSSHSFEYKVPVDSINELEKSLEEGRKRKGGGGGMRMKPFLMLLQIKAAVLGAIFLKLIGLVAFKALLVAKVALTIAGMVALKKLVEHKPHSSTYEVYAHPHYEEHPHFDRSFHQDLAYKGYAGAARSNN